MYELQPSARQQRDHSRATPGSGPAPGEGLAMAQAGELASPAGIPAFLQPVRVHDDAAAHAAATRLGAYAFTLGSDVYLGPGLGQPGMPARQAVVRHETVHAIQTQQPGPHAAEVDIEQQAHTWDGHQPLLAADPAQPHGLWWFIPLIAGGYVLLRPNVANAPGPGDRTYPSVSPLQVAAEAFFLFGVPGGVGLRLARAGWTVVGVSAAEGAIASVGYRGVQDVAAGEFSGIEAYVVDATTGALVGVVVGGVFQVWRGAKPTTGGGSNPDPLYHHTNAVDAIESSGHVRGYTEGRVYTTPAAEISGTRQRLATGVGSPTGQRVAFTDEAAQMFQPHPAEGIFSWYKRRGGQYVSQRIGYNLAFDASAAARQGNTLSVSAATWQRQPWARYLWSHSRLWGRRLLVDWGIPALGAGANIGYGVAYNRYPSGRTGIAGQEPGGSTPTSLNPAESPAPPLGGGLSLDPGLGLSPAFDLGLEAGPGLGTDMLAPDAGGQMPLTLAPFLPGEPTAPDTAGSTTGQAQREVQIIYVQTYDMAADNSVARIGYNADCPSCHDRANRSASSQLGDGSQFGTRAQLGNGLDLPAFGARSTLPNFLEAQGQMNADQRAALEAYIRTL